MLYHRKDDVKKLQKVIANTEHQFVDCLRQIKTLGEEKVQCEQRLKELEDLRVAAQELVEMVDPLDDGAEGQQSLLERLR
jgi:hypothetical protein